ncbi:MAG TPA: hypothetical protein VIK01_00605 [Polyangiaceae bacterium]
MPKAGVWHPFVTLTPLLWFGHATAFADIVDGSSVSTRLPSLELLFTAGVRLLR